MTDLLRWDLEYMEGIENSFAIDDCPINTLLRSLRSMLQLEGGESFEELLQGQGSL